jgi:hypothetical protein
MTPAKPLRTRPFDYAPSALLRVTHAKLLRTRPFDYAPSALLRVTPDGRCSG